MPARTPKILVIDDEPTICRSCRKILASEGYEIDSTTDPRTGLESAISGAYDLVITDVKMPEISGIDILRIIKEQCPWTSVIVITGYSTVPSAVEAMKEGAFDYVPKPFTPDELSIAVKRAFEKKILIEENEYLKGEIEDKYRLDKLVGKSRVMQHVFNLVKIVAPTNSSVLIFGESGTGKELVARAIHYTSSRSSGKFVPVDCNTLSDNLFESEIFGHEKGAFTGAVKSKKGLLEEATGGTLFLDEISNLTLDTQAKLLRAIEAREVKHVGGNEIKEVDFRLICATNKDLAKMVREGQFREDLFYRINVFPVNLPPLRNRPEDISLLAVHFMKKFCSETTKNISGIDKDALELLASYDWPGNVRELKNIMERLVIMTFGETIDRRTVAQVLGASSQAGPATIPEDVPLDKDSLKKAKKEAREQAAEEIEKNFVLTALKKTNWNVSHAARETGMQRQNFQALMRKFKIQGSEEIEDGAEFQDDEPDSNGE
ncbi:MAG TPA: sigma-54 dependent transcriptional regulator [bacterium]|nr:sigma-54 dependent transcriptional regulator [bacterium]